MEGSFLYTFEKWNEKLTILIEKYDEGGIDQFFTDDNAKDLFQNFECIFGYTSVPATTFCLNSALLWAGDKSPSDVFPLGTLACTFFTLLNKIEDWNENRVVVTSSKGGKWTQDAARGRRGVNKTGEVAVDPKRLAIYNSFCNLHLAIMRHEEFSTFNEDVINLWRKQLMEYARTGRALAQGKANKVTEATMAPDFEGLFDDRLGIDVEPRILLEI